MVNLASHLMVIILACQLGTRTTTSDKLFHIHPWSLHTKQYALFTMDATTSTGSLASLKFGYGYVANQKSVKLRFTLEQAGFIVKRIPAHAIKQVAIAVTQDKKGNNFAYLAMIAHPASALWQIFDDAVKYGKADLLRAQADNIISKM
jgi:hypothetical protein